MKPLKIGVVMDPINIINPKKDSTVALMLEAQRRGFETVYFTLNKIGLKNDRSYGKGRLITIFKEESSWYRLSEEKVYWLEEFDAILMRKDPPFNIEYIMATYVLQHADEKGCLVVNNPQSLRDVNEKVFTSWLPECTPDSLISQSKTDIKDFLKKHKRIIVKPTDRMGGQAIFILNDHDLNTNVIIEELTDNESKFIIAQEYISAINKDGDKRIILINGEPIPFGIKRTPMEGDHRGNMATGAHVKGFKLSERDLWICNKLKPELQKRGLFFVGIDVIGDYLTEINVTSPTGIQEIDSLFNMSIAFTFFETLENVINEKKMI